jgi:glutamate racemase
MLKMLLLIACATAIAVALLELRQQRLELNYQTNVLHDEIEHCQSRLWNQQLQIGIETAPSAIAHTVTQKNLHFASPAAQPHTDPSDTADAAE